VPVEVSTKLVSVKSVEGDVAREFPSRVKTASELLERINTFWTNVDSFRVWSRTQSSAFQPWLTIMQISAKRPWSVAIVPPDSGQDWVSASCNESTFILRWPHRETTLVAETGGTLEPLLENPYKLMQPDSMMPLQVENLFPLELFTGNPSAFWTRNAEKIELVGMDTIESVETYRLRIHFSNCHRDIWIAADGPPVPVMLDDTSSGANFAFTHWEINPTLDSAIFQPRPAVGFTRQDIDIGAPGRSLIGQQAPTCSFERLDGTRVDLAALKRNRAVVLSFWGSHCGPCMQELARFPALSTALEKEGVQLLAVNHTESRSTIEEFVKDKTWGSFAAVDPGGQAATFFEVSSIPHLVVIDREGIVRLVKVGDSPRLEAIIRGALGMAGGPENAAGASN
jgi:peroxiredoxin